MLKLMDRDDFEAEASKETLLAPLPVAGVTRSSSPLASLITFLSTQLVQGEAKNFDEAETRVASCRWVSSPSTWAGFFRACSSLLVSCRVSLGYQLRSGLEEEPEGDVAELVIEGCCWSDTLETWDEDRQ